MAQGDQYTQDDGRTIADMSDVRSAVPSPFLRHARGPQGPSIGSDFDVPTRDVTDELQDGEERLMVLLGTLKAALSLGMVYIVVFGIAIAFMLWLWR